MAHSIRNLIENDGVSTPSHGPDARPMAPSDVISRSREAEPLFNMIVSFKGLQHRVVPALWAAVFCLAMPLPAIAQQLPGPTATQESIAINRTMGMENGTYCSPGFKKFFSSFTSYQFGNPFVPGNDPLSRLEFPIDQWFAGIRSGYRAAGWFFDSQAWINTSRDARAHMQDSDWDDETMPKQKTIFSESRCRLNRGLLFDVAAGMIIPLDLLANLGTVSGVLGCRYESLYFTTYDGIQTILGDDSSRLQGDGIDFTQNFNHYYLGGRMRASLDPSAFVPSLPQVNFEVQIDYGFVKARNQDLHLVREGDRVTTENTRGHCWHAFVSMEFLALSTIRTAVELDFKRSLTHGSHRLTNSIFDIDFSFDGSRVWSDQISLSATAELAL
jgi:hypothetical protein